jgi:thiosulfate dehydrogenase (quinone) large subunit
MDTIKDTDSGRGRWGFLGAVSDLELAYAAFRITLGVNIFFHGAMRLLTGLDAWVVMQAKVFEGNPVLPMWAVLAFLYVLPFVEAILGALTALGLFTRWALLAGSAMIFWLVFGNLTRQDWGHGRQQHALRSVLLADDRGFAVQLFRARHAARSC